MKDVRESKLLRNGFYFCRTLSILEAEIFRVIGQITGKTLQAEDLVGTRRMKPISPVAFRGILVLDCLRGTKFGYIEFCITIDPDHLYIHELDERDLAICYSPDRTSTVVEHQYFHKNTGEREYAVCSPIDSATRDWFWRGLR